MTVTSRAVAVRYSAYPLLINPMTTWPTMGLVTLMPALTTVPATSPPRIAGSCRGILSFASPLRSFQSIGLTLVAATSISTSSGKGSGRATSSYFNWSISPYACKRTAFISSSFRVWNNQAALGCRITLVQPSSRLSKCL